MKLFLNKNAFIDYFLNPVSKISDNLFISFVDIENSDTFTLKSKASTPDGSFNLFSEMVCKVKNPTSCIIPDCKTFLRLFSGIEDDNVVLNVDSNSISYEQNKFSFKYYLLDESYFKNKKTLSEEKINSLHYDTEFDIKKNKISELSKFHSIIPDAEKLYIYSDNNGISAKIGDEQKTNINEVTIDIADSYKGANLHEKIPINIQHLLLFSFNCDTVTVKINHSMKVFKFETPNLKYVLSGLVK